MARIYRVHFGHVDRDGADIDTGALHSIIREELERQCISSGTLYLAATVCGGRYEPATVLEVVDPEKAFTLGAAPGAVMAVARRVKERCKLHAVFATVQGADAQAMEV